MCQLLSRLRRGNWKEVKVKVKVKQRKIHNNKKGDKKGGEQKGFLPTCLPSFMPATSLPTISACAFRQGQALKDASLPWSMPLCCSAHRLLHAFHFISYGTLRCQSGVWSRMWLTSHLESPSWMGSAATPSWCKFCNTDSFRTVTSHPRDQESNKQSCCLESRQL